MLCESGGDALALNPADVNGKPSKGLFQFQDLSWKKYVVRYGLWPWRLWEPEDWENAVWSDYHQTEIVKRMFVDRQVNLKNEFPFCSRKLGLKKNYAPEAVVRR